MIQTNALSIQGLTVTYTTRIGEVSAVEDVSLSLAKGESLGLVGESGCGKTTLALALLRLLPDNAQIRHGKVLLNGVHILPFDEEQLQEVRWNKIAMVFQAAMNSLNPVYRVADQIVEAIETHWKHYSPRQARQRAADLFGLVGLDPGLMDCFPHEFSGGMRQRAMIAMALACDPDIIIADELTTALDVIVQDQVLRELQRIQKQLNMSLIYISHDIAVLAEVSERMAVMYAGCLVELASTGELFSHPLHPYTHALMSAFPSIRGPRRDLQALAGEPPDLLAPPSGCRFHPRCTRATDRCQMEQPEFVDRGGQHFVACWHPVEAD